MDPVTALIGGVSQLYQGDLDLGRIAVQRLAAADLGRHVLVEDLHYGAVAVAQRLQEVRPDALVLLGATVRGRRPGTVERRRLRETGSAIATDRHAIADAVTGYVDVDLVVSVGRALQALPARTVVIEVEPARTAPAEELSPAAARALERVLELAGDEARRAPLFEVARRIRGELAQGRLEGGHALAAMGDLLQEIEILDDRSRWGAVFALRDRLRMDIAEARIPEGMSRLDWGLWWALIEELDRLQPLEAQGAAY